MATNNQLESQLYHQWMDIQRVEFTELTRALQPNSVSDTELSHLLDQIIKNFENYIESRARLAETDPTPFFAPPWCTTLENSGLWLAGCRPSSYIRLIYALTGLDMTESRLTEFLSGVWTGSLSELSGDQLAAMDQLRVRLIREEERLSREMAAVQEDMVDGPLVDSVMEKPGCGCESDRRVESELDENGRAMVGLMVEADKLRLETVKELMRILSKIQSVQFLAASKKIRICMSEWGKKRDEGHGR